MQASHHLLLGKRLLVVTAHPDDESYTCAGTLALHAKAGAHIYLLCATHGEKGQSHLQRPVLLQAMAVRRRRELKAAARVIGIQRVNVLRIPDGTVRAHLRKLTLEVMKEARRFQPDCIISFGPCGITGHRDHIAAGIAARRVARACGIPFAAMVLSLKLQHSARKFLIERRRSPHYTRRFTFLNPTTSFVTDPIVKRRAIRCHVSQMDGPGVFAGFPRYVVEGLLRREYFNVWKK